MKQTISIVLDRDDKTGELVILGDYKNIDLDLFYEAVKYMINQMLAASDSINDPGTRKITSEMMKSCQYILKGGETAMIEFRARTQKPG